jgi:trimethylamine:corrinoid methyltransferase-like protein
MFQSRFTQQQTELLHKYDGNLNLTEPLSDDDLADIQDAAVDILQLHGIGSDDEVNAIGLICEDIIDLTGDND